jgi:acetyl-CoA C-acetyltransferase
VTDPQAHILAFLRTPRGKGIPTGGLAGVSPLCLIETLLTELVKRTGLDPALVDDVILGVATQAGPQGAGIARTAVLSAGWPATVPGLTVNRFCSSGLDAVNLAAALVRSGAARLVVAGGLEMVSAAPMFSDGGPLWGDPDVIERVGSVHMGIAADLVATMEGFARAELDAYGVRTQQRAAAAWAAGRFADSVVPVTGPDGQVCTVDELVRPGTTLEQLAALAPAFAELGAGGQDALALRHHPTVSDIQHLHTVGTSPRLADAAAVLLIGDAAIAAELGLPSRARVVSTATAAADPVIMLTAGQSALSCALRHAGLEPAAMQVVEFAEAFAALCLKIQRDLGFADDTFNVSGGTIAMGHAFGATGAILAGSCMEELQRRGARYGVAAVSGAAGSGAAIVLERTE